MAFVADHVLSMTVFEPRPLVLLAEDHQDTREMYAWYLSTLGWLVTEARDGLEALQRARECRPDAIALDLSLPVLGACEVIRRLRTEEATRCVPIVGLNGYGLPLYSREAMEAGCCRVLVKPCSPDTLAVEIRRVLMKSAQATGPAAVSS